MVSVNGSPIWCGELNVINLLAIVNIIKSLKIRILILFIVNYVMKFWLGLCV